MGSWLVEDCEDKKLQQSDLRVSFALDVVVVAFMNTEGPLVPFPISYYPCKEEVIATYEIRSLSTIIRKDLIWSSWKRGVKKFNTT